MIFLAAAAFYLLFTLLACISATSKLPGRASQVFMLIIIACGLYVVVAVFANARTLVEIFR